MSSRSVSLSAIFGWIPGAFRLVGRALPAFAGASALTILAGMAMMLPLWAFMGATFLDPSPGGLGGGQSAAQLRNFLGGYALVLLLYLTLFPPIMLGWARLCRRADEGSPVSALEVFSAYREPATWLRAIGLALAFLLGFVVLVAVFAAAFWTTGIQFAQEIAANKLAGTPAIPGGTGALVLGYFLFLGVMVLLQWTQMVAANEVALRPTGVLRSLWLALSGLLRNTLKLLVFGFCLFVAVVLLALVLGLVIGLFGAALTLLGPKASMIGIFVVELPFLLVAYPLFFAAAYCMWKSLLGDEPSAAEPSMDPAIVAA
jgi:hypothetical protein